MVDWKCVVPGCKSRSKVPGHYFPKNPALCHAWVRAVNRPDFFSLTSEQLRTRRVCFLHFSEESYIASLNRRRLRHDAVPTKHLPDKPYSETNELDGDNDKTDDPRRHDTARINLQPANAVGVDLQIDEADRADSRETCTILLPKFAKRLDAEPDSATCSEFEPDEELFCDLASESSRNKDSDSDDENEDLNVVGSEGTQSVSENDLKSYVLAEREETRFDLDDEERDSTIDETAESALLEEVGKAARPATGEGSFSRKEQQLFVVSLLLAKRRKRMQRRMSSYRKKLQKFEKGLLKPGDARKTSDRSKASSSRDT